MRICVTGGNGMIGKCLKDISFDFPKHEFIFLHRNGGKHSVELTDKNSVMKYFSSEKYDYIIHLAADVGGLFKNMSNKLEMFNNNIDINKNILEAAHKFNIQRGIFCLSSCIYPENPSKFPMDESMIHESAPHNSNEGYAYAKRMLEVQCRYYNEAYNREYICVVPVNMYGPYDNFNLKDGHLIPMVMHRFYNEQKSFRHSSPEAEFVAYGTGKPLRQFLYAPDFSKIICNILFGEINGGTIICCPDDEISIKELVYKIADIMLIPRTSILWDDTKSDGCMKKTVSNNKFKKIFPDFEFTTLEKGLKYTFDWFCENYKTIRK